MGVLSKANRNLIALAVSCVLLCGVFGGGYFAGYKAGRGVDPYEVADSIDTIESGLGEIGNIVGASAGTISELDGELHSAADTVSESVSIVSKLEQSESESTGIIRNVIDRNAGIIREISEYLEKP